MGHMGRTTPSAHFSLRHSMARRLCTCRGDPGSPVPVIHPHTPPGTASVLGLVSTKRLLSATRKKIIGKKKEEEDAPRYLTTIAPSSSRRRRSCLVKAWEICFHQVLFYIRHFLDDAISTFPRLGAERGSAKQKDAYRRILTGSMSLTAIATTFPAPTYC